MACEAYRNENERHWRSRSGPSFNKYSKKAQKGKEPNDRPYDRSVEKVIRKLKAEELDGLLNGEPDER